MGDAGGRVDPPPCIAVGVVVDEDMTKAEKRRREGIESLKEKLEQHGLTWGYFRQFLAEAEDPKRIAALVNKAVACGEDGEKRRLVVNGYVISILNRMELEDKVLLGAMMWNGNGLRDVVRYMTSHLESPKEMLALLAGLNSVRWDVKTGFKGEK